MIFVGLGFLNVGLMWVIIVGLVVIVILLVCWVLGGIFIGMVILMIVGLVIGVILMFDKIILSVLSLELIFLVVLGYVKDINMI